MKHVGPLMLVLVAAVAGAEAPLATVNKEPVTRALLLSEFQSKHGGHAKFLAGEVELRRALDSIIDRRLFLQEARRLGLHEDPAIAAPVKELEAKTAATHLNDLEVTNKAKVSAAEVKAFFDTKTEVLFNVRQVVVKTRPEAEAALKELTAGADFEKLAREKSVAHTKIYGGLLANLGWGSMDPHWEEVVYKLEKGKLSNIMESKEGFEIVRMEEVRKVPKPEFEKAERRIKTILEGRKLEARRAAFQKELWTKYAVKEPRIEWTYDLVKGAQATKVATEVASWRGGKMTLAGFAERINLDMVAKLPANHHRDQLENLRRELIRQDLVALEVAARELTKAPAVAGPVEARRADLMEGKLFDEYILKGVTAAPEEAKKYYDAHAAEFTLPERRRLQQIVVPTEAKAAETVKKLAAGAKFDALAKTLSTDPESSKKGGDLGWVTAKQTPPEFASVLSLKQGEVSAPIKSTFGFHLIRVAEIAPPTIPPFEQVKEDAARTALRKKLEEKRDFWIRKLRGVAAIVINEAEVKAFAKETAL